MIFKDISDNNRQTFDDISYSYDHEIILLHTMIS